jgi:hypothetical protein
VAEGEGTVTPVNPGHDEFVEGVSRYTWRFSANPTAHSAKA